MHSSFPPVLRAARVLLGSVEGSTRPHMRQYLSLALLDLLRVFPQCVHSTRVRLRWTIIHFLEFFIYLFILFTSAIYLHIFEHLLFFGLWDLEKQRTFL